jgi:hypothetical protein
MNFLKIYITTLLIILSKGIFAQDSRPKISLDTITITGNIQKIKLAPSGEKPVTLGSLSPEQKIAVFFASPDKEHEYDIRTVSIRFNTKANRSSLGRVFIQLVEPNRQGNPSESQTLSEPFAIDAKKINKAKNNEIVLTLPKSGQTLPENGIFVVITGAPPLGTHYLRDTLVSKEKNPDIKINHVVLKEQKSGKERILNQADFISVYALRTNLPVTWDYITSQKKWHKMASSYKGCDKCEVFNYWIELGVEKL